MRFQPVNDVEFDISFKYNPVYLFGVKTIETQCTISSVSQKIPHGRDKYRPVAVGVACQSDKDVFVKDVGRKIALARALKGQHKSFRKLAWEAYHNRKNK